MRELSSDVALHSSQKFDPASQVWFLAQTFGFSGSRSFAEISWRLSEFIDLHTVVRNMRQIEALKPEKR